MTGYIQLRSSINRIKDLKNQELEVLNHFNLHWDNLFLLSNYGDTQTLVVLSNGQTFVLNQKLRQVINDFAANNLCYCRCIDPIYDLIQESLCYQITIKGLIAGHNRLLPSMGWKNPDVVFYTAKYVKSHYFVDKEQAMILKFESADCCLNVSVPASRNKFERILAHADQVSDIQFNEIHEKMHRYDHPHECTKVANPHYLESRLNKMSFQIACRRYERICTDTFLMTYGDKPEPEFLRNLKKVLFHISKH